jgi:serine/threonine-protein kinase
MEEEKLTITCPTCKAIFRRRQERERKNPLLFCAYCGSRFHPEKSRIGSTPIQKLFASISLESEKPPPESKIITSIDHYQLLETIGKGGMGEVFLAYDTICGRKIALKRIRPDLLAHPQLHGRFLREARITSQLTHPTIIPIYSIHCQEKLVYYTMPFVEGKTLRHILKEAKEVEKKRDTASNPHSSIPSLIRIFLQVCQACAYAHAQGVLHRDLKPENFMIGKYGQVLILDWGLAKFADTPEETDETVDLPPTLNRITKIGKVVGTIAYMAPERALGTPATRQSDIYSLGVILYQILTLKLPFARKNLKEFQKSQKDEVLIPPELVAPYREVPEILSEVVKKCLAVDPQARYQSVDEVIQSIESYIEGRSEWFEVGTLDVKRRNDWQFQENILIAEHTAITRALDVSDWVSLMISKEAFPDNTRIEAEVTIGPRGHGIGLLFSHPESIGPGRPTEGYCLWLASAKDPGKKTKLLRSSVTVLETSEIILEQDVSYRVRIEKIDQHIYFYLNDLLQFSYISHIPVVGTHVGILAKDGDYDIRSLTISIGSQTVTIGCLAVPDAFLANNDYDRALAEYRRIGASFPGRAEGREALFRAGITLLEKAKAEENSAIFEEAHTEFEKLRRTPGAPLEYLGKALIYQSQKEYDDEVKCYELALRRYRRHPLLSILEEQIAFRMQESARQVRRVAYQFISLALRFLPNLVTSGSAKKLLHSLEKNWEEPWFLIHNKKKFDADQERESLLITLAFWLAKPHALEEILRELLERPRLPMPLIADTLFALIELGCRKRAAAIMKKIRQLLSPSEQKRLLGCFESLDRAIEPLNSEALLFALASPSPDRDRLTAYLIRQCIETEKFDLLVPHFDALCNRENPRIRALMIEVGIRSANRHLLEKMNSHITLEVLCDESSPLYFAANCLIISKEGPGKAMARFERLLETPYPRSWLLAPHYIVGNISLEKGGWIDRSFIWEKRCLFENLSLYYRLTHDEEKENGFRMLSREACAEEA